MTYAVSIFFFAIIIMDPPEFVKRLAEFAGGTPAQDFSDDIIAGTAVPTTMDKLAEMVSKHPNGVVCSLI